MLLLLPIFVNVLACQTKPPAQEEIALPFVLKSQFENLLQNQNIRWRSYSTDNQVEADKLFVSLLKTINNSTTPTVDPYSGRQQVPSFCQGSNLPSIIEAKSETERSATFSLYAMPNFFLGCLGTERLKAQALILYCKKSGIVFSILTLLPGKNTTWPNEAVGHCK